MLFLLLPGARMTDRTAKHMNLTLRAMYALRDQDRLPAFANRIHQIAQTEQADIPLAQIRRSLGFLVDVGHVVKEGDDRYGFPVRDSQNEVDRVYDRMM